MLGLDQAVLAGGSVQHHEGLHIRLRQLPVDDAADLAQLVHQVLLIVQAAGGIDNDHVGPTGFGGAEAVIDHGGRVAALLVADDVSPGALRPDAQLLGSGGTEGIPGAEQDALALGLQLGGDLADGGGLAHAVDAHHQDDGGPGVQLEGGIPHVQQLGQQLDEAGTGLVPLAEAPLPGQLAHGLHHVRSGGGAHIRQHQQLLQLLIEILTVGLVTLEQLFQLLHIAAGLGQAGKNLVKKSHIVYPIIYGNYSSMVFWALSRSSSMTVETPFSCMVTP